MIPTPTRPGGMFGNVSACRHTLGDQREEWRAAMCGSCLALRDGSGQLARAFLNTDAIAAAVLAGDAGAVGVDTRRAGPCPARAFRTATVWDGPAARVGAAVSLLAAGVTLGDAATDGDVPLAGLTARPARVWARRLLADGGRLGDEVGIDARRITAALARSRAAEAARSQDLTAWCDPVEEAYRSVFEVCDHGEVGAAIGRVTLLVDAVADVDDDAASGAPNPILAGACTLDEAVARVRADVAEVGRTVAARHPGSLAATLWGPAWSRGTERAMAPVTGAARAGAACRTHGQGSAAGVGDDGGPRLSTGLRLVGSLATVGTFVMAGSAGGPDDKKRRGDCCCDACDGCCECDCCDCDCCDCCGCDC